MKIRNGFVSNSSSSSFIATYDKLKVTNDPEEVYHLIIGDPNIDMLFMGYDCGEGDDIFILTEEEKSLIRRFKKEFIKNCTGTYSRLVDITPDHEWIYKDCPKITVYFGPEVSLIYDNLIDCPSNNCFDVDMSDVKLFSGESLSVNDFINLPEDKKNESNEYYKIKESRQEEAYNNYVSNKIASLSHDDVEAKVVNVSYRNCSEDEYYFKERYISNEEDFFYDNLTRHYIDSEETIYTLIYKSCVTDFNEAKDILNNLEKYKNCYITRYDDVLEYDFDMDLYEVKEIEAEYLLKDESLINTGNISFKLFTDLYVLKNGDTIEDVSGTVSTYSGRVAVIESSQAWKDFKDTFYMNPDE